MHTILTQLNILMSLYVPFQIALLKHTGGKGIDDVERVTARSATIVIVED